MCKVEETPNRRMKRVLNKLYSALASASLTDPKSETACMTCKSLGRQYRHLEEQQRARLAGFLQRPMFKGVQAKRIFDRYTPPTAASTRVGLCLKQSLWGRKQTREQLQRVVKGMVAQNLKHLF